MMIPILFTFDHSLEMPAGVCITSLLENAYPGTFYDIFVLHGPQCDFSQSRLHLLPEKYGNCRITFRKVEGEFEGAYEIRNIPETAYYRLISPDLIPEYDKYLYSDVDVIFRDDLTKYYNVDLGFNFFLAVDNGSRLRSDVQKYVKESLSLDVENGYYYSGNLVINARQLRTERKLEEFRFLGKNRYQKQDMDIINIACNRRILSASPAFCLSDSLYHLIENHRSEMDAFYGSEEIQYALTRGIVHYNGPKPWKTTCVNMDIWWMYYRKSIFYDEHFCHDFWSNQRYLLSRLSLWKRIKLLMRYPLDRIYGA